MIQLDPALSVDGVILLWTTVYTITDFISHFEAHPVEVFCNFQLVVSWKYFQLTVLSVG
jgi:hypothetical protein